MRSSFLLITALFIQNLSATIYEQSSSQFVNKIDDNNSAVALALPVLHILPNNNGTFRFESFQMENTWNICSGEALSKAPPLSQNCTGFLIAPDILVTAGHCMVNHGEVRSSRNPHCEGMSYVFGYHYEDEQNQKLAPIKGEQIVHCKKVLYAANLTDVDLKTNRMKFDKDFAVVQLERKMPYKPFTLAEKNPASKDFTPGTITMIGHPFGMPMVESKGTSIDHKGIYFRAAINSFPGNSGSAVKNKNGEVMGILVRGYPGGFVEDKIHKCELHNRCDSNVEKCTKNDVNEISGEHIQLIDKAELSAILK